MDLLETLRLSGGVEALARHLGVPTGDVMAGAGALLPEIIAGMRRFVVASGGGTTGLKALAELIDAHGDGDLALQVMGQTPVNPEAFAPLLDVIAGTASERENLVIVASARSGAGDGLLSRLLPLLAMLVCGYVSALSHGGVDGRARSGGPGLLDVLAGKGSDD